MIHSCFSKVTSCVLFHHMSMYDFTQGHRNGMAKNAKLRTNFHLED